MAYLNENYLKLQAGYLFPEVARRVREFCEANPKAAKRLIRCGIGDVTEPLPRGAIEAMKEAVEELGDHETFRGYGPEQGYEFLRSAIAQNDYRGRNIEIADDEIFISDGSKCDCGYILDILGDQNKVAAPDPVYPVYVDTNVMAGHTGPARRDGNYEGILYLPCTAENNFVPDPPKQHVDLVYLCFPNNPTGAVATREQLENWVDYAHRHEALILFDAAYEAYINDDPHLNPLPGQGEADAKRQVRVESKIPHSILQRRWSTKSNSVSYPVQRGAEALYSQQGRKQVRALVDHYMGNAKLLRDAAADAGLEAFGGVNAPYIWVKTSDGLTSWQMFDRVLRELNVVITPGAGFGAQGEGHFRISAFNSRENAEEVARRLKKLR
ncbi:MAG: LL-diaminopimelate aminotransferase [Verrucomicrobia bacterium]|nr:MAG: LL-diaminopimelate aminotransferase [Verrucomicrobiota bacterium]